MSSERAQKRTIGDVSPTSTTRAELVATDDRDAAATLQESIRLAQALAREIALEQRAIEQAHARQMNELKSCVQIARDITRLGAL